MGLTKKRRLVLANYTSDPNCTLEDVLIKAGYSKGRANVTACELRKDPEFIQAIERRSKLAIEKLSRSELTQTEVINAVRDIDDECKAVGLVQWALALRIKCQELLGKNTGAFTEKIEIGVDETILAKLIEGRERARLAQAEPQEAEPEVSILPALPEGHGGRPS
jgi:hypothetical protein